MNEYEREREARIAKNKAALASLTAGLLLTPPPVYRGVDADAALCVPGLTRRCVVARTRLQDGARSLVSSGRCLTPAST
jgi:hypothetical protein